MLLSNCVICGKRNQLLLKIIDKFLLTGDKFVPELHLKQPGFTYSAFGPFTKHCERVKKFRETGNLKHLYRNDIVLKDRACEIARNRNYDGCQKALASMANHFFIKKTGSGMSVNEQLAEELHKPVIKKLKRRKV